ncbi:MAG: LytTR family transcriptional regulator DNA-binding domain-containing protein [Pseudomonadota bacterium]
MQSTLREMTFILSKPRLWVVFAGIVLIFAITGPFGTYIRLGATERLGYWLIVQSGTWLIALFCISTFIVHLERYNVAQLARITGGSTFASIPISLFVVFINNQFFGFPMAFSEFVTNVLISAPIAVCFGWITWMLAQDPPETPVEENTEKSEVPLLDRLPPELRGELIAVSVEDHYTRVITNKGSHLMLMRFSDALKELQNADGLQVHRSHWVAENSVDSLIKESGRLRLKLTDGQEVPVSRTYSAEVREQFS